MNQSLVKQSDKEAFPTMEAEAKEVNLQVQRSTQKPRGAVKTMETVLEAGKLQNSLSGTLPLTSGRLPARVQHRLLFS